MNRPYKEGDKIFKSTPLWLFLLCGFRRTEIDIWRSGFGARKYLVRHWVFWVIKVYEDCRVFGRSDW